MLNYYVTCWKKYVDFSGRASRPEYWYFFLANFLITLIFWALSGTFMTLYYLAVLIPSISVFVRRMHDAGHSAWNLLWVLVPIVGPIILIILACLPTKAGK